MAGLYTPVWLSRWLWTTDKSVALGKVAVGSRGHAHWLTAEGQGGKSFPEGAGEARVCVPRPTFRHADSYSHGVWLRSKFR